MRKYNLILDKDIEYFINIKTKDLLITISELLKLKIEEPTNEDLLDKTYLLGNTIITITDDNRLLELEEVIDMTYNILKQIAKDRDNNYLEELYIANMLNLVIFTILDNKILLKSKDKKILKDKLPDIDKIMNLIDLLNNENDKITFNLDVNEPTVKVIKSILEELDYEYGIKNNILYIEI